MARTIRRPLKRMADLNSRELNERRFAKRLGFRDERAYRAWVKKYSSLPESDPRYFRTSLRGNAREAEIKRLKKIVKQTLTPAKEIRRKANILVYQLEKFSAFSFLDRYLDAINKLLRDGSTSSYDKQLLRDLLKKLNSDIESEPVEEGKLF
jgi:pantothenate kinase